jgi:sterol desaturase/sphingolipid hydroxylase (fatty acid hydroxylase superfamily)
MDNHELANALDLSMKATYILAVGALIVEFIALRVMGERVSHREGRASLLSGLFAFGGLALANRFVFVGLMYVLWSSRVVDLGLGVGAWVAAFVLYDLMFYVAHRAGHRIRLLWCFHSVHHTSEEMRLTTAVRGSAFDFVYLPWFFIWIPLLGVHPAMVLIVEAFGRVWGVLTHVHPRFVGQLGWLDRVLVTPSVHRVHHGRYAEYIDRNYGEVLTIWDHLFRSYRLEDEAPEYGVLAPVDSGDLRDIQLSPWGALWRDLIEAHGLLNKLRTALGPPGANYGRPPN